MHNHCKTHHTNFRTFMRRLKLTETEFLYLSALLFWTTGLILVLVVYLCRFNSSRQDIYLLSFRTLKRNQIITPTLRVSYNKWYTKSSDVRILYIPIFCNCRQSRCARHSLCDRCTTPSCNHAGAARLLQVATTLIYYLLHHH